MEDELKFHIAKTLWVDPAYTYKENDSTPLRSHIKVVALCGADIKRQKGFFDGICKVCIDCANASIRKHYMTKNERRIQTLKERIKRDQEKIEELIANE